VIACVSGNILFFIVESFLGVRDHPAPLRSPPLWKASYRPVLKKSSFFQGNFETRLRNRFSGGGSQLNCSTTHLNLKEIGQIGNSKRVGDQTNSVLTLTGQYLRRALCKDGGGRMGFQTERTFSSKAQPCNRRNYSGGKTSEGR